MILELPVSGRYSAWVSLDYPETWVWFPFCVHGGSGAQREEGPFQEPLLRGEDEIFEPSSL